MKSIVRSLLLCFLMLALPFQAFAAASMLPRVAQAAMAVQAAPGDELPPCHRQTAQEHQDSALKTAAGHDAHTSQHDKGKCGSCAACCVGAALASGLPATLALAPPSTDSIPFRAGHLPSVDPVLPERPPSILFA